MEQDLLSNERAETTALLWRLSKATFLIPLAALGLLYLFSTVNDISYSKREWKTILLAVWGATLVISVRIALQGVIAGRRSRADDESGEEELHQGAVPSIRSAVPLGRSHRVNRWEDRRSRQLTTEFAIAGFLVPVIASVIAYQVLHYLGTSLSTKQLSNMCAGAALMAFLYLILRASRARHSRPMYSVEDLFTDN